MTTPEFASNRDNFCYRHPDRQSFVLCQRCLRTICGECQTPAAVGVICPECMKAERKNRTPAQKRAERRWGSGGRGPAMAITRSGRPVVTYTLLAITSFIGLLMLIPDVGVQLKNILQFATPYLYPQIWGFPFEPWRLLTSVFAHGGFIHLALNMLALWLIGQNLEAMLGRARFLALYLISGLGGSVMVALIGNPMVPVVGASGALFGMMAALLIIGRHIGANVTGLLVILGINFVYGLFVGGISWQAHLGGLLVGALVSFIFLKMKERAQRRLQIAALVGVVVALLVIVAFVPPLYIASWA